MHHEVQNLDARDCDIANFHRVCHTFFPVRSVSLTASKECSVGYRNCETSIKLRGIIHSKSKSPNHPAPHLVKNLLTIPPATFRAMLPVENAFPARFEACPNLSHLEKARVFVMVRPRATTLKTNRQHFSLFWGHLFHSPTRGNHFQLETIANTANAIQRTGCAYKAIQKKRLSVAFITLTAGSELSKTQWDSPESASYSFHHLSPTSRRPAMFLR